MNRWTIAALLPLVVAAWVVIADAPPKVPDGKRQVTLNGHTFTLPVNFDVQRAAGAPVVSRPIHADFDEQGRLYVTEAAGSIEKPDVLAQKKVHRILRLESSKGDGHFDKQTVFAEGVAFPEGTMWYAGSLYVAAPPSIWKFTDTDGDGVADQRSEWFQGKTIGSCANDLHGPYLGPDGWIYWAKGAFAKQTYERPSQAPFVTRASHIFRCKPDGTGVEAVMTGGMDNPVDVVFTPGGERIFNTTFFQHPAGGSDGLIHAIYGGVYGKDHDVVHEHKWTAPTLMPVLAHLGPAAPSGLHRHESTAFGPGYEDNVYCTLFNMQKVTRHALMPSGATFASKDKDFLVSSNRDFHPTDVIEDADGSLLVIDTGGWYKLCCPTSQLVKPDVLGGIYRIRRTDAPKVADPRGLKVDWAKTTTADMAKLLGDVRPVVRRRAVETLAARGPDVVPALKDVIISSPSSEARRHGIWTATRIDHPAARAAVRAGLADRDETVRQAALHSVSINRDPQALAQLLALLRAESLHNRRAAAEALGRINARSAVPRLLAGLEELRAPDRTLEHSLTYALIEIADRDATSAGLASGSVTARCAALVALDQMDGGRLDIATVAKETSSTNPKMKETVAWIVGRHPEWGGDLAGWFRERLKTKDLSPAERDDLARQMGQQARATAIQELLVDQLHDDVDRARRILALRAMAGSGLKQAPTAWVEALPRALGSADTETVREAVLTVRALALPKQRPEKLVTGLVQVGAKAELPASVRLTALAAIPGGPGELPDLIFTFAKMHLDGGKAVADRALAADVLARAKLTAPQLLALTEALQTTGPMELNRILEAYGQSNDEKVGLALIAALKTTPAQSGVHVGTLRQRFAKYGPAVQKQAEALYAALDADAVKQKERLEKMLASLATGDVRRGQEIFNGTKAACSSCHAVGYLGGTVGPDLTRIGSIRQERDLLESILYPSASFTQGFEPVVVATKDGKFHNGLLRKNAPDEVVLVLGANQELRIARDDIEEMQPSKVSVMPAGLEMQLAPQDLADLVAFLRACK